METKLKMYLKVEATVKMKTMLTPFDKKQKLIKVS